MISKQVHRQYNRNMILTESGVYIIVEVLPYQHASLYEIKRLKLFYILSFYVLVVWYTG